MKKALLLSFVLFSTIVFGQQKTTSASDVNQSLTKKSKMMTSSLVKNINFTNIGPTVMSGRVVDVAVNPYNTTEFYVGYASGGLWYTNNNGTTFTPLLDNSPTQNIGDIAVDWNSGTIWVGTGEKNSSRSSYAGIGMLKSTDKGKTWVNVGLLDSHHISRIVINPNNTDEVVVGVIGHLYSSNKERGIFKTIDGGKTWTNPLFINNDTGVIDVAFAPENFNIMYAASWERERKAWNFDGDGKNSAIYKSTDAGSTWTKISDKSGFPVGDGVGRIGLAVFNANTVYALHDSQFRRPKDADKKTSYELSKDDFKTMSKDDLLKLEDKKLNTYLKNNGFQEKYRAQNVKQMVRVGSVKPVDLASYLEDANSMLFDTPVIGAEVFKTTNGGKSWKKTHTDFLNGVYSSYGYYFGEIRVDLQDENGIYVLGVPIIKSKDGGKTFTSISRENVHSDHQALWVNPKKSGHILNGNDGGLNLSYDDGENWTKLNDPAVGQFYAVYADNQKNYKVYGGLQDNGVWVGANNARMDKRWQQSGQNPYESIMGGDGMQVQVDDRNPNIVYTGYQFGNYFRIDREGRNTYIQPKHTLGETPYRFNWQTPILLSKHNQDILYLGGNKLHRSLNQGDDWETISDDLTTGGKKGNVAYGTLTTISESPFQFGLIYVGSDDGYINLTKNGGGSWTRISNNLPQNLWVTRVIASAHKKERVYATLNGYRSDNFTPYVYMSDDYGQTWQNIGESIPTSAVNVIKEDPANENVLYLGTDNGLYVSFDKGTSWSVFSKNLPNVAVHDLVVQPTAKHLIVGTHGRSLYKADIAPIQKMTKEVLSKSTHIFTISDIRQSRNWGSSRSQWRAANEPELSIPFYSKTKTKTVVNIYKDDVKVNSISVDADKGFNAFSFDVTFSKNGLKAYKKANEKAKVKAAQNDVYYLPKGKYVVKIGDAKSDFQIK
ncbi:glycosyl hydrolase [Polaribacter vadi]|uniref:VPS10 domain-containing protein n=1 Tax=Polaribacter TaxID=52959 RepID=UPI001C082A14|nr:MULTISPECIES: sialidase family protein [Polaribacter]MBU3011212.1 glycosyl hydrolase [Polaribacter vadi]MDO6741026.1 glycosyl hydrolase [Polaribacter sp. 1_MG-2023]